jgi:hypothetical protein
MHAPTPVVALIEIQHLMHMIISPDVLERLGHHGGRYGATQPAEDEAATCTVVGSHAAGGGCEVAPPQEHVVDHQWDRLPEFAVQIAELRQNDVLPEFAW